jgi:hypothetical protein
MSRRIEERAPVVAKLLPVDHGVVARDDVGAAVPTPMLAAVWCCSVGATWTVELHEFDHGAALGPIVDWISSGVPISDPEPTVALARELLTERGFQLFLDSSAGPRGPHRHGIGYACRDTNLVTAAPMVCSPGADPWLPPPVGSRIRPCVTPSRRISRDTRIEATKTTTARPQIPTLRPGAAARAGHGGGL